MTVALIILALQTLLGALDNILHHEITERLPSKPSARRELQLHSAREAIYGVLFLIFAWIEPAGAVAIAVLALLMVEVAITIADFLEEDRTRRLPPFERVLHTVLAVTYGSFLAIALPWLFAQAQQTAGIAFVTRGPLSWFFTLASLGVLAFAVRNVIAVRRLGARSTSFANVPPSGRTVLVTGATGFIGAALVERLLARGDRVFALSRDERQSRALLGERVHHVERLDNLPRETRIDAVVNLAGAPIIGLPWTKARRADIWRSRIDLTDRLVDWMKTLDHHPAALISGSAIGIYGDQNDEPLTENSAVGKGFAADLCRVWEDAARRAATMGTRVVCLRIGLVLHAQGGALPLMALPARLGLGAILGDGRQWMSWIARDDLIRMIIAAVDDPRWHGAVNAVAPEALRHAEFQRALARTLHRPLLLKSPAMILRAMLGEMSSIFLFSQRVVPSRAQAVGFAFDVHFAADALMLQLGAPPPAIAGLCAQPAPSQSAPQLATSKDEANDDHALRRSHFSLRAQDARGARRKRAGL